MPPKQNHDYTLETMKDVCSKRFGKKHQLVITDLLLIDSTASEKKIALIYNETGDRWVLYYQIQTEIYLFDPEGKFEDENFDLSGFINANKSTLEQGGYSFNFCRSWFVFSSYKTNPEYAKSGPVVVELAEALMNLKKELTQVPMQSTKPPYLRLIERNTKVFGGGIKQFNLSANQLTPHLKTLLVTWPNLVVEDSSQREIALQAIERIDADEKLTDAAPLYDNTPSAASQRSFSKKKIKSKAPVVPSTTVLQISDDHECMTQVSKQHQEQQDITTAYQKQIDMLTTQIAEYQTQQAILEERYANEKQATIQTIQFLENRIDKLEEDLKIEKAKQSTQISEIQRAILQLGEQSQAAFVSNRQRLVQDDPDSVNKPNLVATKRRVHEDNADHDRNIKRLPPASLSSSSAGLFSPSVVDACLADLNASEALLGDETWGFWDDFN